MNSNRIAQTRPNGCAGSLDVLSLKIRNSEFRGNLVAGNARQHDECLSGRNLFANFYSVASVPKEAAKRLAIQ